MNRAAEIDHIRQEMGDDLLILGHYYQADDVLAHADFAGDSLDLARRASQADRARKLVFCGVHFMAESADLLGHPAQTVYLPDPMASCPMALMAMPGPLERAWAFLTAHGDDWMPVTYVNSTAAVKSFCGERGGLTCTSSNARRIFSSILQGGRRLFFMPDTHLGTNTAHALGISDEAVAVYDPGRKQGGLTAEDLASARCVLWKGFCIVHVQFRVRDLERARKDYPAAKVIVHPETPHEVARRADAQGSTSRIIRYVEEARPGTTVVVGTERQLVHRLAREHAQRGVTVVPLADSMCRNMAMITEEKLLHTLQAWPPECVVRVPEEYRDGARTALERMLAAGVSGKVKH